MLFHTLVARLGWQSGPGDHHDLQYAAPIRPGSPPDSADLRHRHLMRTTAPRSRPRHPPTSWRSSPRSTRSHCRGWWRSSRWQGGGRCPRGSQLSPQESLAACFQQWSTIEWPYAWCRRATACTRLRAPPGHHPRTSCGRPQHCRFPASHLRHQGFDALEHRAHRSWPFWTSLPPSVNGKSWPGPTTEPPPPRSPEPCTSAPMPSAPISTTPGTTLRAHRDELGVAHEHQPAPPPPTAPMTWTPCWVPPTPAW